MIACGGTLHHDAASMAPPTLSAVARARVEGATVMAVVTDWRAFWMVPRHGGRLRSNVLCTDGESAQEPRQRG
ncbi:hypothetical protein UB44_10945 [Burkholderiaceae bacterium 26]|nr:hypothetical protein UB44_10945 [Burkholderiaceae bacterium 26]